MSTLQKYHLFMRILATLLVLAEGLYVASTDPGPRSMFNALVSGTVLFAIWFANEGRTARLTEQQRKILEEVDRFKS